MLGSALGAVHTLNSAVIFQGADGVLVRFVRRTFMVGLFVRLSQGIFAETLGMVPPYRYFYFYFYFVYVQ
jgi:hypothetical protein